MPDRRLIEHLISRTAWEFMVDYEAKAGHVVSVGDRERFAKRLAERLYEALHEADYLKE